MAGHLHGVRGRTGTRVDQNPGGPHRPARLRVGGVFRPTQTDRPVEEDRPPSITPRPGDGCLGDLTLPLGRSNPGRAQATGPHPGAGRPLSPPCQPRRGRAAVEARSPGQTLRTPDLDPSSRPGTGAEPAQTRPGHQRSAGERARRPSPGTWSDFHDLQPDASWVTAPLGPRARMPEHAQQKRLAGHAPAQRDPRAPGCVERHISPSGLHCRIPTELHRRLRHLMVDDGTSVTALVIAFLEAGLQQRGR